MTTLPLVLPPSPVRTSPSGCPRSSRRPGSTISPGQAPIYGGSLGVNFLALCSGYEDLQASTPLPWAPFPERRVSGLINGASWDAATPWVWSIAMARAFPSMRNLQVVGSEHGIYTNAHSSYVQPAQLQPFP